MKKHNCLFILTAFFLTFSGLVNAQTDIVITEISYNPPESGSDSTEYVELHNKGNSTIDMSGYQFASGFVYTFPSGISIAPGGYFVVAVDSVAVQNRFGISGVRQWTSGGLSNGGEPIALKDAFGNLVDSLRYDDILPWPNGTNGPADPDGSGPSIELCDINSDNTEGTNWNEATTQIGSITINGNSVYGTPGTASTCPGTAPTTCPSSFSATACDSYTVPSGDETHSMSGIYMDTISGIGGCDSIMTITLTLNNSTTSTDVQTACDSYTWIDGNTYTSSNNTATHVLTNVAGCDSVVTLDLTINSVSDITTSLNGTTVTATNTNATYQWLDCDNTSIISGETNQTFTSTSNGNYAVELTENGCIDTSACVNVTTVGIDELGNTVKILAFPNPTTGAIQVTFEETVNNVELILTDLQGKTISSKVFSNIKNTKIELEGSRGVYFLTIKTPKGQNTIKLIKE